MYIIAQFKVLKAIPMRSFLNSSILLGLLLTACSQSTPSATQPPSVTQQPSPTEQSTITPSPSATTKPMHFDMLQGDPEYFMKSVDGRVISSAFIAVDGERRLYIAWIKHEEIQEPGEIWTGENEDLLAGLIDENGLYTIKAEEGSEWSVPSVGTVRLKEGVAFDVDINDTSGDVGLWFRNTDVYYGQAFLRIALDLSSDNIALFIYWSEDPESSDADVVVAEFTKIPSNGEFQIQLIPSGEGVDMVLVSSNGKIIGEKHIPRDLFPYGIVNVQLAAGPGSSISVEKYVAIRPKEATDIYSMIAWMSGGKWELAEGRQEENGSWWAGLDGEWLEIISADGIVQIPGVEFIGSIDPEQLADLLEKELALENALEGSKIVNMEGAWVGENPEGDEFALPASVEMGEWIDQQPEGIGEVLYFEKHNREWFGIDQHDRAISRRIEDKWGVYFREIKIVSLPYVLNELIIGAVENISSENEMRLMNQQGDSLEYGVLFKGEVALDENRTEQLVYLSGIFAGGFYFMDKWPMLRFEIPLKYQRIIMQVQIPAETYYSHLYIWPSNKNFNTVSLAEEQRIQDGDILRLISDQEALGNQLVIWIWYKPPGAEAYRSDFWNLIQQILECIDSNDCPNSYDITITMLAIWADESLFE